MGGTFLCLLAALEIQAAGSCPGASEVRARLAPLLPPGFPASSSDAATLEQNTDGSLTISLVRSDGGATAQRRLPRAASCADQAEVVAVTLAVWEAEIHPELSLNLNRLPQPGAGAPAPTPARNAGSAATASPATAAAAAPPATPARPAAAVVAAASAERRDLVLRSGENAPARGRLIALGAGLAGAWQPDSLAPGGRVELTGSRPAGAWRIRLSITGVAEHQIQLTPGQGNWWRVYAGLGLDYALDLGGRWAVVAGLSGVAGLVRISGSGYPVNRRAWSADLGGEGLLRLERRGRRLRPWLALAVTAALRRQEVAVGGTAMTASALPRFEPMLVAGGDFLWGP